jgi:valyl-tRNA synthetase
MKKAYEAKKFEDDIYSEWLNSGYFNPDNLPNRNKETFSIVLPPPNVTGQLHIGHAAMLAYQDLMVRYHRMKGDKTLWLPGMDHAAIATQTVVDKKLKAQGIDRHQIGREKFLEEVDKFVNESKTVIKKQLQKMGSSLDWSRERYTMDEGSTKAVQKVFIDMYNDALIYRGKRVVNWCPHCQSTLADDEVEYKEQTSPFYYFKYGPVVIGTARPETKFSDKVIIVHPQDKRYKDIVGKEFEVEWIDGKIKTQVIADMSADMEMGTGAMTITPAHSMIDYELAQKYNLKIEEIINKEGQMTEAAGDLAGLPVKEARKKVVEILKSKGLVEKIDENYVHNLSVCYRCGTPIEPLPSEQWFVNVNKPIKKRKNKTLKQLASEVVKKKEIEIIPDRFNKTYFQWMDNLRDWCISRQIWFGHRIPVWYKGDEIIVPKDITKLSFMRHGITDWNKEKIIQGKKDTPLDEMNTQAIKDLIPKIKKENYDLIISSPLKRAKQTAEILNENLKLPLETNKLLVEKGFGEFEGVKKDEKFKKQHPGYSKDKLNYDIPGDSEESPAEVLKRIEIFLEETLKNNKGKKILIVCHGTLIRYIRSLMVNESPLELSEYKTSFDKPISFDIPDNHYKLKELKQDPDTLDTWFSSGLWTFSTLGGPDKTKDLKEFHPNSVMETGYDILFFWVARMILMTTYALNEKPFDTVYLHGLVRDKQGRKMSKSLGNGIDPLEMIKDYGADALRLSMIVGSTPGNDVKLYDEKIAGYRNFVNKLWNISRYILTSVEEVKLIEKKPKVKTLADKWILDELDKITFGITDKIDKFQFSPAGEELYDFTWNKLADWYLEIAKVEGDKDEILLYILQNLLKLWHPFTPYITEVIWKNFKTDLLLIQRWPELKKYKEDKKTQEEFQIIKNIIAEIRKFKNENKIDPAKFIECLIISKKYDKLINTQSPIIEKLARVKNLRTGEKLNTKIHLPNIKIYLNVDIKKSNEKEIANLRSYIKSLENKLNNEKFVDNAPTEIVEQEKKKLAEAEELLAKMSK